jgi:hypothetical protein
VWDVVVGTRPRPAEGTEEVKDWDVRNSAVREAIISCIKPSNLESFLRLPNASNLWKYLQITLGDNPTPHSACIASFFAIMKQTELPTDKYVFPSLPPEPY